MLCLQLPIWRAVSMLARLRRSASWFSSTRRGAGRPERVLGRHVSQYESFCSFAVFIDHCVAPARAHVTPHTSNVKQRPLCS